jgi:hypothetical protein
MPLLEEKKQGVLPGHARGVGVLRIGLVAHLHFSPP